jgi:hypothetical protein
MNKILILSLILMTGCTSIKEVPVPTRVQLLCDQPLFPIMSTLPIEFQLATNTKGNYVLGLDGENYSNLAINTRRMIEFAKVQADYIDYLQSCIDRHNKEGGQ